MKKIGLALFLLNILFSCFDSSLILAQDQKTVVLFSPGVKENQFWTEMIDFAKSVSSKMSMNLLIYYGNDNAETMAKNMDLAANLKVKPDGFIFPSMIGQGDRFIEIAENYSIPSIIINMGINESLNGNSTRDINPFFIGQITPDDEAAGYELAKTLIMQARLHKGPKSRLNLVAFSGRSEDIAAIDRVKGLKRALTEFKDINLSKLINTDWTVQSAIKNASLLENENNLSIVWCASDLISISLSEFYQKKGLNQGKDIFIGGIDWTKQGLEAIKNGKIATSVGGHFAEAGWAIILFYDYFNGRDFASERTTYHSIMKPLISQNVQILLNNSNENRWSDVNFKTFSKVLNPSLKSYNFDLVVLLRMAKQ